MRNIAPRGGSEREPTHICNPVAAGPPPRVQSILVQVRRILVATYATYRLWRDWERGWWS